MKKLTASMLTLLAQMQVGARVSFSPYMGRFNPTAHYTVYGAKWGRCTKAAEGLLARDLVKRVKENPHSNDHDLELTAAGREFDAQQRPEEK